MLARAVAVHRENGPAGGGGTTNDTATTPHGSSVATSEPSSQQIQQQKKELQAKLLKNMRRICADYRMLEDGDHIMVCVSGGKDSATLLDLLLQWQERLRPMGTSFDITAVHVDQKQPGYNGTKLVQWLEELSSSSSSSSMQYKIVQEDTYSIVRDKTPPGKAYCSVCSRLRRGILYSTAIASGCNKIALGHHANDCLETLFLNMLHGGVMKAMPARYTSQRGSLAVLRPLITCQEDDIAAYAALAQFPILPCHLCSSQEADLQRPAAKLLVQTLQATSPTAAANLIRACRDVRPSHLLDQSLRQACGMDPVTGEVLLDEDEDASL